MFIYLYYINIKWNLTGELPVLGDNECVLLGEWKSPNVSSISRDVDLFQNLALLWYATLLEPLTAGGAKIKAHMIIIWCLMHMHVELYPENFHVSAFQISC